MDSSPYDVVLTGAGWAGVWTLHKLRELGFKVCLYEAEPDVGGVWSYTRYPGCFVDTEFPFYEFGDSRIWQEWEWDHRFPAQPEIHEYFRFVCRKLDLYQDIVCNTYITKAEWNEETKLWQISGSGDLFVTARFFCPCTGYATVAYFPGHEGAGSFKEAHHTSQWPGDTDLTGKRVGVIGTGASGIQVIEAISKQVSHLTVFQRTPNLAVPIRQRRYTHEEMQIEKKKFPALLKQRFSRFGVDSSSERLRTFDDSAEERQRFFQELYDRGGLSFWFRNYRDMTIDDDANQEAYKFWRSKTIARIKDPATAELLAPAQAPHPFGAKRPSLENKYFEVFNQDNVRLVDVNKDPIIRETPVGIITSTGLHEFDVLCYATGFDFMTASQLQLDIRGRGGQKLDEKWQVKENSDGVWTCYGLMTAGFPNMFFPDGPQSPTALTPLMAEIEGAFIATCVKHLKDSGKAAIETTHAAEVWWKNEVERAAMSTVFGKATSWYMGVNIPGRKKQPLCYFGGVDEYANHLSKCASDGYSGCIIE